jgi:hypothetical protein
MKTFLVIAQSAVIAWTIISVYSIKKGVRAIVKDVAHILEDMHRKPH